MQFGDIAKVESIIKGIYVTPAVVPPSKKQARVVGDNILRNKCYI